MDYIGLLAVKKDIALLCGIHAVKNEKNSHFRNVNQPPGTGLKNGINKAKKCDNIHILLHFLFFYTILYQIMPDIIYKKSIFYGK